MSNAVVDVRVTLPETWWVIPLQDPIARERSISALLTRHLSEPDQTLGTKIAEGIRAQVERAASVEARLLALNLQEAGGIPVAASLVLSWIDAVGEESMLSELRDELQLDPAPEGYSLDLARLPQGRVLRRVHVMNAQPELPSFLADYWLERPDGSGMVHLVFGTPLLPVRDAMLELFDAVVAAVRWVREPGSEGAPHE